MSNDVQKIIAEYSEEYCLLLEAAYGSHMMSEGGEHAIDRMFSKETLQNKVLLDIGFGLGGVAFYLAEKYQAYVSGIEINPWMVKEATHRTPENLKERVHFFQHHPDTPLAFPDNHFDIVFSKGVLTHLKDKRQLFSEIKRILKPGGAFIVDDWLSPETGKWGERLDKMCATEGLTLYAETEEAYKSLLSESGFINIVMRDENSHYYQYNTEIVQRLLEEKKHPRNPLLDNKTIEEFSQGYQLIADSIKDNELLIRWFRCVKS